MARFSKACLEWWGFKPLYESENPYTRAKRMIRENHEKNLQIGLDDSKWYDPHPPRGLDVITMLMNVSDDCHDDAMLRMFIKMEQEGISQAMTNWF